MANLIGLVRRTDTGEVIRVVFPLEHEDDSVLDDPQWVTMGFENHDCEFEMLKVPNNHPRAQEMIDGVMSTPKVI